MGKAKSISVIFLVFVLALSLVGCGTVESKKITSLDLFKTDAIELVVGKTENSYFIVKANGGFSVDDLEFVSSNTKVAIFEYDKTALNNYVYYNIKGVSASTAIIHAQTKDGTVKTKDITVTVK